MENRKPLQLKNALILYNLFQVIFSSWLFYEVSVHIRQSTSWYSQDVPIYSSFSYLSTFDQIPNTKYFTILSPSLLPRYHLIHHHTPTHSANELPDSVPLYIIIWLSLQMKIFSYLSSTTIYYYLPNFIACHPRQQTKHELSLHQPKTQPKQPTPKSGTTSGECNKP